MNLKFATPRLKVRPINLADALFMLELMNSEGWLKFIGDRDIIAENDAEIYIQKILDNPNSFYHVFELKESNQPIGVVTFLHRENEKFPDFGFALLPEFERKGYTYEASHAYLDRILEMDKNQNIIGITNSENIASQKLLEKLGFAYQRDLKKDKELLSYFNLKK